MFPHDFNLGVVVGKLYNDLPWLVALFPNFEGSTDVGFQD